MVNYDLPWNPNRLEQRFGRIHRIGQTEVCHLWNLVGQRDTRGRRLPKRLLEKLETARETLGGKVYDVLGELFEDTTAEATSSWKRSATAKGPRFATICSGRSTARSISTRSTTSSPATSSPGRASIPATVRGVRDVMERAAVSPTPASSHRLLLRGCVRGSRRPDAPAGEGPQPRSRVSRRLLRDRDRLIGRGDPVLERYRRICFDKALCLRPAAGGPGGAGPPSSRRADRSHPGTLPGSA